MSNRRAFLSSMASAIAGVFVSRRSTAQGAGLQDAAYRFTCKSDPAMCKDTYGEDVSEWPTYVEWMELFVYNKKTGKNDLQLGFASFGDDHGHVVWRKKVEPETPTETFEGYNE